MRVEPVGVVQGRLDRLDHWRGVGLAPRAPNGIEVVVDGLDDAPLFELVGNHGERLVDICGDGTHALRERKGQSAQCAAAHPHGCDPP